MGRASGFQLMALISALASVLYYAFYYCFLKKVTKTLENETNITFVISSSPIPINAIGNFGETSRKSLIKGHKFVLRS
jgi:hypothetical protein